MDSLMCLPAAIPARIARERFKKTTAIYQNVEGQTDGRYTALIKSERGRLSFMAARPHALLVQDCTVQCVRLLANTHTTLYYSKTAGFWGSGVLIFSSSKYENPGSRCGRRDRPGSGWKNDCTSHRSSNCPHGRHERGHQCVYDVGLLYMSYH